MKYSNGKGVARGLWDKVPDQPGCYTIDLKLVDHEAKPTSHQQVSKVENDGKIEYYLLTSTSTLLKESKRC